MTDITLTSSIAYEVQTCADCGTHFAITKRFAEARRKDGARFYCPNGHRLHWGDTEVDKLQRRLAASEGNRKSAEQRAEREKRRHAATKGQLTKTKKRIAGGVCPCCNRSFVELSRHMKSKHPEYVAEDKR